jgi:hypothetical protein
MLGRMWVIWREGVGEWGSEGGKEGRREGGKE